MQTLISSNEARTLARPVGRMDEAKLLRFVEEIEDTYVVPSLGYSLMKDLRETGDASAELKTLLDGGEYVDNAGEPHCFRGLKVAEAYLTYAKVVMYGDYESTRYGMVSKDGDYSSHISSTERSAIYSEALELGQNLLRQAHDYAKAKGLIKERTKITGGRGNCIIKKIG